MNRITDYQAPSTGSHFLVTGGGKGITAANVIALALAFQSRFTLVGRSALLEDEPGWSVGLEDEPSLKAAALAHYQNRGLKITPREIERDVKGILSSREIKDTLKKIEQSGGSGEYIQADITDLDSLQASLGSRLSDIDGLIHGAGTLADKYIQDKTEDDFGLVYGVKVTGLKNVLGLIQPEQLRFLVLFSSVAGFYGNAGQADYSIANEILNKFAHHIKQVQPGCQVVSIGWGPWDGGMVTPQLKRIFERRNIPLITPQEGTSALVDLLKKPQDIPQVVIGNPLPTPDGKINSQLESYQITRKLLLSGNPFLADHIIGGKAVLPTVCAVSWFIQSCEALYPGFKFFAVRDYQVFKGIVFEEDSPKIYKVELKEIEKDHHKLVFAGKISSEREDGVKRFHYQAEVELRQTLPARPQLDEVNLEDTAGIPGADLYLSKILFHGPRFQGVERILNIRPKGLTTQCRLPLIPRDQMGQFLLDGFDPILADVHLQSLLIWASNQEQTTGLPLRIGSGIQYQPVPRGGTSYATMRVKKITPHKLVADVISHDDQGWIFTKVSEAEITLNKSLSSLFQQNQLEQALS